MKSRTKDTSSDGNLDDFRITSQVEIGAMLKRLADGHVQVSLNAPNGTSITASVWTSDAKRNMVSFSALHNEPRLDTLVECDEAMVIGYLDSIKVQFDVNNLVLVRGDKDRALYGAYPRQMFRFQRRSGFRVQPMLHTTPVAKLRHPMIPDMELSLRVLDVSIGGCALFLPNDVPSIDPGVLMNGVTIDLDADTRVATGLRLQHVTSLNPESGGVRLGCEMVNPGSQGLRSLQLYIDQTQKRRRLLEME